MVHGAPGQHDLGEARQGRARPGLDDRALDDRGRGARPRHQPDARHRERHRHHAEQRRDRRQPVDPEHRQGLPRRGGVPPARRCSALASTKLGVPAGSLSISNGVISGGGGRRAPASWSAASCSPPRSRPPYGLGRRRVHASEHRASRQAPTRRTARASRRASRASSRASARYSLVGIKSPRRFDIPAKVNGTYTYVHNVRIPGMLHGRVGSPARAGRRLRRRQPAGAVGRPEVDLPHPERPGRADRQLRRRRRAGGVRRDPGGRSAEGHLGADAEARGQREHVGADAGVRQGRPGPGTLCRRHGQRRQRPSQTAAEDRLGHATPTRTTPTSRSARRARSPG